MSEDNKLLNVNEHDKFLTNYKAVYQAMTAKHDCKSKIFSRNIKVSLEDILDLNNRVLEKLRNYTDAGFSISVTASFEGRQTIEFSSWREFENHKWIESYAINSITIIWEFNAVLPQFEVPQKHVLVVKIADGLRPEELLNIVFAGKLENIGDIENQMYPVVARVDFINYILGDELLGIVETWNNGLELQDYQGYVFSPFLVSNRRKLAFACNYITNIVTLVCSIKIISHFLRSFGASTLTDLTIDNICVIIWIVGIIGLGYVFINKMSQWFANILYGTLGREIPRHVFFMNKGDNKRQKEIQVDYMKNKIRIAGSIAGTVIMNIICSVLSSFIVK